MERKLGKADSTVISVYTKDGKHIQGDSAVSTLVLALREMLKTVDVETLCSVASESLGELDCLPMIKRGSHVGEHCVSLEIANGYYVNAHCNTEAKKKRLDTLSKALGLGWKIEIVSFPRVQKEPL